MHGEGSDRQSDTGGSSASNKPSASAGSSGVVRSEHSPRSMAPNDEGRKLKKRISLFGPSFSALRPPEPSGSRRGSMENWQGLKDMEGGEGNEIVPLATSVASRSNLDAKAKNGSHSISIGKRDDDDPWSASISGVLSTSPPRIGAQETASLDGVLGELEDEQTDTHGTHSPVVESRALLIRNPSSASAKLPNPSLVSRVWPPSPVAIAITKCVIAYTLASLFTFVPVLSRFLSTTSETDTHGRVAKRPNYSAHMVATVVVYYNPAKTIGGMFLATRFCIILATFATLISYCSMGTVRLFDYFSPSHGNEADWISEIGDWFVCIVWIGGSMGAIAFARVWVNNPSFNTGCSMAAITIYTVVIKEGASAKLLEVLLIILLAACITNLVCFTVFPVSSTTRLQTSISKSLTSFSTLLDRLCATFLLERNIVKDTHTTLKDAVASHAAAFKKLKSDLEEAKHERIVDPRIRGPKLELFDAAVASLSRLAQHLAGLRGCTKLQEGIVKASKEGKIKSDFAGYGSISISPSIMAAVSGTMNRETSTFEDVSTSIKLLLQFRDIAGEQMENLVARCDDALEAVQAIATSSDDESVELLKSRQSLSSSLKDFNKYTNRAIKRLYAGPRRDRGILEDGWQDSDEDDEPIDQAGLLSGPNETVFLIYFFIFTLEEFARELLFLADTVIEIQTAQPMTSWQYIKSLWRPSRRENEGLLYKQFRKIVPIDPSDLQPAVFPRRKPDATKKESLRALSILESFRHRLWKIGEKFREPKLIYALKTAIGGAMLASPAYIQSTRPIFLEYRGEWALIAYFSAISPTVGQTNLVSVFRVLGTLAGATIAVLVYTLFPENAIVLPILGGILSIPAFYVITQMTAYAQAGRFTLLTYNLTCLYAFNSRERDISATYIAYHRSTSVIVGVIWAAIVSRYWWPFTARRELRLGLSDFCLDLSYLYSKLVTTYSRGSQVYNAVDEEINGRNGVRDPLLPRVSDKAHLGNGVKQFVAMELHLQGQLQSLRGLLAETKNEPRLKGPFAFDFYKEALLSCERMVDRLHSMRCVTTRDEWDNGIRESFVLPVNPQRRQMVGNVILYFYTLSAGFRLRTPMPPYLPPAEEAREQLVAAIRKLDIVRRRSVRGGGRHLLYFAYASAMQEVIAELEYLGKMMQDSFGVISQNRVTDFEALFQDTTRRDALSSIDVV